MSEALDVLGQVCLLLTRSLNANHGICCQPPASATACQAQSVKGKALNLVVVSVCSSMPRTGHRNGHGVRLQDFASQLVHPGCPLRA
jgi:hypothetical protein